MPRIVGSALASNMGSLIYRCPFTARNIQDWVADDGGTENEYVGLKCPACKRVHLVNALTGRVLGAPEGTTE
jgi:hypothetical protein